MRQVSLLNYYNYKKELNKREKEIYNVLELIGPTTSWGILWHLEKQNPNYVRPRLTDLQNKGLVRTCGKKLVQGKSQYIWEVIA